MSKLTIGNGEFLEPIPDVHLTSSFGTDLTNALKAIEKNFKKLISVPFLKGEHGEDVKLFSIPLFNGSNLTKLGEEVFKSIYGSVQSPSDPNNTLDANFGGAINTVNSYDNLVQSNPSIAFYGYVERTQSYEKIVIASQQLFIFMDGRINALENISSSQLTTFEDLSCALTIIGELAVDMNTGDVDFASSDTHFDVTKHNIIPTLYYDNDSGINEWCWKINGAKSKISAQGLAGQNGQDASVVVCAGTKVSTDATNTTPFEIRLDSVLTSNGVMSDNVSSIPVGQLAIVWFKDGGKLNCTFGRVEGSSHKTVYVGHSTFNSQDHLNFDLMTALDNISLRNLMDDITHTENTPNVNTSQMSCRGIWVPDKFVSTPNSNNGIVTSNGNVHMIWAENPSIGNKILHFGLVNYAMTNGDSNPPINKIDAKNDDNSQLNFHYDTINKDFIEIGRTQSIPSYATKTSTITNSGYHSGNPIRIVAIPGSTGAQNINQYITIKGGASDGRNVSLNSNGIYLIGNPGEKVYAVSVNSERVVMESTVNIGNSNINITGSAVPSTDLSPLTSSTCKTNLMNDDRILINQENVVINKGNLVVGSSKTTGFFNIYTQHYGNMSLYNFDYGSILADNINGTYSTMRNFYWSNSRPRYAAYVPVQIGGWLSMYKSKTVNQNTYIFEKSSPVELTQEENWKQTFLSGKFGYTASIVQSGINSDMNSSFTRDSVNAIKEYQTVRRLNNDDPILDKYGVSTSVSAIWTKIGNVVDVKGKIFFNGVKLHFTENSDVEHSYSVTPVSSWPLSYNALYDFLAKNISDINFPFPVVLKNSSGMSYISTGNIFENDSVQSNINEGGVYDTQYNTDNSKIRNFADSIIVYPNEILNGAATIHFYGNTTNAKITTRPSGDYPNQFRTGNLEGLEALPNVFTCTANIKKNNNDTWTLFAIPQPEVLDGDILYPDSNGQSSRFGNRVGPVRISNGFQTSQGGSYPLYYRRNLVRPVVIAKKANSDSHTTNEHTTYLDRHYAIPGTNIAVRTPSNTNENLSDEMTLYTSTVISPYIVRYLTFQFSYLLDDDIYGNHDAVNRNGESRNYDSEEWPLTNRFQNIATTTTQEMRPNLDFEEVEATTGTGSGSTGGSTSGSTTQSTDTPEQESAAPNNPSEEISVNESVRIYAYLKDNIIYASKTEGNPFSNPSSSVGPFTLSMPSTQNNVWAVIGLDNSAIVSAVLRASETDANSTYQTAQQNNPQFSWIKQSINLDTQTTITSA